MTFGDPEPYDDGWVARRATFENERGQRFAITAAAPDRPDDQEALGLFTAELRVYLEADPVEEIREQEADLPREEEAVPLEDELEQALRVEEGGTVRAIVIDVEDLPDVRRSSTVLVSLAFDPWLGYHDVDCWTGPGRFGIDVSEGRVRVDRPGVGSREVGAGAAYLELAAQGTAHVVGLRNSNRYAGDRQWTRRW